MSEYMFGSGYGRLAKGVVATCERVAKRHRVAFTHIAASRTWTAANYWFSGPNRGDPFDRNLRDAVWADLDEAGALDEAGKLRLTPRGGV